MADDERIRDYAGGTASATPDRRGQTADHSKGFIKSKNELEDDLSELDLTDLDRALLETPHAKLPTLKLANYHM